MGLLFHIDIEQDLGYPPETPEEHFPIDYTAAINHFAEVFSDSYESLCPVDTGFLLNSCAMASDHYSYIEATVSAPYAEYVEFGTWKMMAQPYFIPSLQEAYASSIGMFEVIYNKSLEAEDEFRKKTDPTHPEFDEKGFEEAMAEAYNNDEFDTTDEGDDIVGGFAGAKEALLKFLAQAILMAFAMLFEAFFNTKPTHSRGGSLSMEKFVTIKSDASSDGIAQKK